MAPAPGDMLSTNYENTPRENAAPTAGAALFDRIAMTDNQPKTRTEATAPAATSHLNESQKKALDLEADAAHTTGKARERLTRKIEELGSSARPIAD